MKKLLPNFLAAFLATTSVAEAQSLYAEAKGWPIFSDTDACYMASGFDDGTTVLLGLLETPSFWLMNFSNPDWDIADGEPLPATVFLDKNTYDVEGEGADLDGISSAMLIFDDTDFVTDLKKSYVLRVYAEGEEVFSLSLDGTYAAIETVQQCVNSL